MKKRLDIKCQNKQNPRGYIPRGFCGADGGTRYGASRLHAHVGENRSLNAFLPLRSLLFESLFT